MFESCDKRVASVMKIRENQRNYMTNEKQLMLSTVAIQRMVENGFEYRFNAQCEEKTLKAKYSPEINLELKCHGIDVDAELANVLCVEIEAALKDANISNISYIKFEEDLSNCLRIIAGYNN